MKSYVVDKLREWYDIPTETNTNRAAIFDRVKYLLDDFRYIFEKLSVRYPYKDVIVSSGFDFAS